jgi:hypothetical protein
MDLPRDLTSFAHKKFAPMVRGSFPRREWKSVLTVLEKSVVFLTPDVVETVIRQARDLGTAREVANIYLTSIGASPLDQDGRHIVGFSVETTCYVSIEYFAEGDPFSDFVVHEVAHLFHNTRRISIGLPETRQQQWLLPIDYRNRELFAYATEAYSRIRELAKDRTERRRLLAELSTHPPPPDDRVEQDEYLDVLSEAIVRRNGWKAILERCS